MGVLKSALFTQTDETTQRKLEDCATGRPSEVASHFKVGHANAVGEHIRLVQQALWNVRLARPELEVPAFEVNGIYDETFAGAVRAYKTGRDIRNYAGQIDDVVGINTLKSLDSDNVDRPHVDSELGANQPSEFPRALPNCVPDSDCPPAEHFEVTVLIGASTGDGLEVSKYWMAVRDVTNDLSALYLFSSVGAGWPTPLPVSIADGGAPKPFTADPVRVTRFGPTAAMAGITMYLGVPGVTGLTLQYQPESGSVSFTAPLAADMGAIALPGASIHGASLTLLSQCNGQPGATRGKLSRVDALR